MTRVTVENVWKAYGDQTVLENVNLEIEPGSFMALVGPSGCGKSTFLRMMLGDEAPSRGRILLDGEELDAEPSPDRGVVFQKYSVFPHLTALQNRSEEHTSELQSQFHLVCRLLLEKKNR